MAADPRPDGDGLLARSPVAVAAGAPFFAESLERQGAGVIPVEWTPPTLAAELAATWRDEVDEANREAMRRLVAAHPVLVDVRPAIEVIPGMTRETVLHAGPPITWERMSGPVRGAVLGGLVAEGLAQSIEDAERMASTGAIRFDPCHHHATVGPMAGIVTASMPVYVIENRTAGNRAYSTINEGLGKVLRYGAYGPEVFDRLRWFRETLGPALGDAIRAADGVDVRLVIGQALQMGDECHNRNRAASALVLKLLAPHVAELDLPPGERGRILAFASGNEHFFLNIGMAACKASLDAAHGIPRSSLVTTMARNGTDFGIRVSGLGARWFAAPADTPVGLYFPGFGPADANPDVGDSAITETAGIGGFAMGGAPAIVQFVGGTASAALEYTRLMYEITMGESEAYRMPVLDFRGTPTGIDVRLVAQTGILPQINTGIAHREAGVGQIGAGLVRPPRACFDEALCALAASVSPASAG